MTSYESRDTRGAAFLLEVDVLPLVDVLLPVRDVKVLYCLYPLLPTSMAAF